MHAPPRFLMVEYCCSRAPILSRCNAESYFDRAIGIPDSRDAVLPVAHRVTCDGFLLPVFDFVDLMQCDMASSREPTSWTEP
jgi:hypothetical protein